MTDYTGYSTTKVAFQAIDNFQMQRMPIEQYKSYIQECLFILDSQGVVRTIHGEHPIATTKEQIDALVSILVEWRGAAPLQAF